MHLGQFLHNIFSMGHSMEQAVLHPNQAIQNAGINNVNMQQRAQAQVDAKNRPAPTKVVYRDSPNPALNQVNRHYDPNLANQSLYFAQHPDVNTIPVTQYGQFNPPPFHPMMAGAAYRVSGPHVPTYLTQHFNQEPVHTLNYWYSQQHPGDF